MKIIIPMAGKGDRFVRAGYKAPKPLIKINNKKMIIEYILDMFDPEEQVYFICNKTHIESTDMEAILKGLSPGCKIFTIDDHKKGPVHTVLDSGVMNKIDDDDEVIVSYCDNPSPWDYEHFKKWVKVRKAAGCVISHNGFHPHRLNSTFMAHIKEDDGKLIEIKEKEPYTENPMNEHASTGIYYFNKASYIKKYFVEAVNEDLNYNGEYYVTLVYNLLVRDGLDVYSYLTEFVNVFGTPDEVENFEAWQTILKGSQVKNEDDLLKCYNYWKKYNERHKRDYPQ